MEEMFATIKNYHQLTLANVLSTILKARGLKKVQLWHKLKDKGFIICQNSLYRYFKEPDSSESRIPDERFMELFIETTELSQEQQELLLKFYAFYKQTT